VAVEAGDDSAKLAELTAIIEAVRARVRARYPEPNGAASGSGGGIAVAIADLMPLVHARDAAQAKIAAIGSVNPRRGGLANRAIQLVKKTVARSLQWFVRDQITFNRETVSALEAVIEALNEHNRALVSIAAQANERDQAQSSQIERLEPELRELKDIRSHWSELRASWESRVTANEIQFLRSVADLQGAFQHRSTLMETNFREIVKAQHADYLGALDRTTVDIHKSLWADFQKVRAEYGQMIHDELRIIRLRQPHAAPPVVPATTAILPQAIAPPAPSAAFDYTRFAFRFRGPEEHVRQTEGFYRPFFAGCRSVLDIGCGRGEFLDLMREMEVPARGIDLGDESVAQCTDKGLKAEVADLFTYLGPETGGEFDGIFASQIVEHLDPARLPEMIRLCAESLRRGGILAIETPNPACLAIFATYFYLDPTHTRPVPHALLEFYMEEAGLGSIEVHELSPAVDSMPELSDLPESFRKRFFGGLDYAIVGRKL
jgi:2-polyprenyl-3-methyl-5-hydroxy-6-metoxy-1,4-benzoquinol methylase